MSAVVGLYSHPDCELHAMQPGHPEAPERLAHTMQHLQATGLLQDLQRFTAIPLTPADLTSVHQPAYIARLTQATPGSGLWPIDPDTVMNRHSLRAALLAGGATTQAVAAVLSGQVQRAFCAVRPPGHHAEEAAGMGFCLVNSVALAARHALDAHGLQRVAILDFDVHHGNGTVDIFQRDPRVLVCSTFQHPFYPNRHVATRAPNIVNSPLPAGTTGRDFRRTVERDWTPALATHDPELILVSAGFDAHRLDPLAGLELDYDDFTWVTEFICAAAANDRCRNRVVSTLEGGYHLDALARSVACHISALLA